MPVTLLSPRKDPGPGDNATFNFFSLKSVGKLFFLLVQQTAPFSFFSWCFVVCRHHGSCYSIFKIQPTCLFFSSSWPFRMAIFVCRLPCRRQRPENYTKNSAFHSPKDRFTTGARDCPHCSRQRLWVEGVGVYVARI